MCPWPWKTIKWLAIAIQKVFKVRKSYLKKKIVRHSLTGQFLTTLCGYERTVSCVYTSFYWCILIILHKESCFIWSTFNPTMHQIGYGADVIKTHTDQKKIQKIQTLTKHTHRRTQKVTTHRD